MHHRLASASQPAGGVATTLFIRLQPVARHHRPCFAAMQASPHVVCLQSMTWYVYGSVCVAQCRRGHWRGMGIVFVCVGACYARPGKYPCGAPVGGGCPWGMGSCPQHHNGLGRKVGRDWWVPAAACTFSCGLLGQVPRAGVGCVVVQAARGTSWASSCTPWP